MSIRNSTHSEGAGDIEKKYWSDWGNRPWDDEELRALEWKRVRKFKEVRLVPGDTRTWETNPAGQENRSLLRRLV